MQDVKATGYDSLCQTGVEDDSRLFWRSYRTFQGLKTNPFLSRDKNETLRACGFEIVHGFAPGFVSNAYAKTHCRIRQHAGQDRRPNWS